MSIYLDEYPSIQSFDESHSQSFIFYEQHSNIVEQETTIDSSFQRPNDRDQEENLCQICGDIASGWHCG